MLINICVACHHVLSHFRMVYGCVDPTLLQNMFHGRSEQNNSKYYLKETV